MVYPYLNSFRAKNARSAPSFEENRVQNGKPEIHRYYCMVAMKNENRPGLVGDALYSLCYLLLFSILSIICCCSLFSLLFCLLLVFCLKAKNKKNSSSKGCGKLFSTTSEMRASAYCATG